MLDFFRISPSKLGVELEISPLVLDIIKDARKTFGDRAWSSMVVKRLENKYNTAFREYPEELIDLEEKILGYEI